MDQKISSVADTQAKEFVISRTFGVPRELMFRVWTDPQHLQHWWGPKGFTVIYQKMDLRPGGIFHYCIRSADGHDMWGRFLYREIVSPERLVFVNSFSDEKGNVARHSMHLAWPLEMLSTITFTELAGRTTVTVRWLPLNATEEECKTFADGFESMQQGWGGTFEQLGEYLAKATTHEVHITRIVNASRELVFKAWTDPARLAQWWGPEGFTNPVCEVDARAGGTIRIHMRAPDGTIYPMTGAYREIVEPERLVFVSSALDARGQPLFEVLTVVSLTAQGDKTLLTVRARVVKTTPEAAPYIDGMNAGWTQSLERLEQLVVKR